MTTDQLAIVRANPDKIFFPFLGNDNIFTNGISIDRVAFRIPGTDFVIYWYGLLIGIGLLLGVIYAFKNMRKFGIDSDRALDASMAGFIAAIIGARLYFVLFSWDNYKDNLLDIFKFRDGGLAIYGGLIGAVIVGGLVARIRKLRVTPLLDLAGMAFLIGQGIGRWGNFFNQEAYGTVTTLPWGMTSEKIITGLKDYTMISSYSNTDLVAHPCFLYESLWCLLGFLLLHLYKKHRKFDGEIFLMYIGWYGFGRFIIEGLRTDSLYLGNLRVSQLVAGTCVLASVILILVFRGMVKRSGDYQFFYETELSKQQIAAADAREEKLSKKKSEGKEVISESDEVIDEEIDITEKCCNCENEDTIEGVDDISDTEDDDGDDDFDDDEDCDN